MSDGTKIEWTDATWNIITGCSVVSPGCTNCYAMKLAGSKRKIASHPSRVGLTRPSKAGPVWTGEVRFNDQWLTVPLHWRRPRKVFVCAHGDLFHEKVPDEWIDRVFAVMALAPQHQFQLLTKRPERMREYLRVSPAVRLYPLAEQLTGQRHWYDAQKSGAEGHGWPLPNVWLGVSVEDQARADERIPHLLATPAAVRWISAEPLLGPIDLDVAWHGESALEAECWGECNWCRNGPDFPPLHNCQAGRQSEPDWDKGRSGVDWVVAGGESGPGARPMHPDWARSLRDQCASAGVPFLFKQWGDWLPVDSGHPGLVGPGFGDFDHCRVNDPGNATHVHVGKHLAGRLLDGQLHDGFPA